MTDTPNPNGPSIAQRTINETKPPDPLEQLSRVGAEGGTPAVLGITATLLEQMVYLRLANRLTPWPAAPATRYRISENGTAFLSPRDIACRIGPVCSCSGDVRRVRGGSRRDPRRL